MENVESALQIALDPNADINLKSQAIQFCDSLKVSENGSTLCLDLFLTPTSPQKSSQVKFFALQVIDYQANQFYNLCKTDHLNEIKRRLFNEYFGSEAVSRDPGFIQNKVAQVLARVVIALYPHSWTNPVQDFIGIIEHENYSLQNTALVLRILDAINSCIEMECREGDPASHKKNVTDVKDALRRSQEFQCITQFWHRVASFRNSALLKLLFPCMAGWITWYSIESVANNDTLPLICSAVHYSKNCENDSDVDDCAIDLLISLISKKMPNMQKLSLLSSLNLPSLFTDSSDFENEKLLELSNAFGLELVQILKTEKDQATLNQALYAVIQHLELVKRSFFSYELDTSRLVSTFVCSSLTTLPAVAKTLQLSDQKSLLELIQPYFKMIVIRQSQLVQQKLQDDYYDRLHSLEQNLIGLYPDMYIEHISELINSVRQQFDEQQIISLIYQVGEFGLTLKSSKQAKHQYYDSWSSFILDLVYAHMQSLSTLTKTLTCNVLLKMQQVSIQDSTVQKERLHKATAIFLSSASMDPVIWPLFAEFCKIAAISNIPEIASPLLDRISEYIASDAVNLSPKSTQINDITQDELNAENLEKRSSSIEAASYLLNASSVSDDVYSTYLQKLVDVITEKILKAGNELKSTGSIVASIHLYQSIYLASALVGSLTSRNALFQIISSKLLPLIMASLDTFKEIQFIRKIVRSFLSSLIRVSSTLSTNLFIQAFDTLLKHAEDSELADLWSLVAHTITKHKQDSKCVLQNYLPSIISRTISISNYNQDYETKLQRTEVVLAYFKVVRALFTTAEAVDMLGSDSMLQACNKPLVESLAILLQDVSFPSIQVGVLKIFEQLLDLSSRPSSDYDTALCSFVSSTLNMNISSLDAASKSVITPSELDSVLKESAFFIYRFSRWCPDKVYSVIPQEFANELIRLFDCASKEDFARSYKGFITSKRT